MFPVALAPSQRPRQVRGTGGEVSGGLAATLLSVLGDFACQPPLAELCNGAVSQLSEGKGHGVKFVCGAGYPRLRIYSEMP